MFEINPGYRMYFAVVNSGNDVLTRDNIVLAAANIDFPIGNGLAETNYGTYSNTHRAYPPDTTYTFTFMFDNIIDMYNETTFTNSIFDTKLSYNGNGECKDVQAVVNGNTDKIPRRYYNESAYRLETGTLFGTPRWDYNDIMNRTGTMPPGAAAVETAFHTAAVRSRTFISVGLIRVSHK